MTRHMLIVGIVCVVIVVWYAAVLIAVSNDNWNPFK